MANETFTLYKLIVLYMLSRVNFPLNNAQICDLVLEKEYTSYFSIQQVLAEMCENDLLLQEQHTTYIQYSITDTGISTIDYFYDRIPEEIRKEIDVYLKEHDFELRKTVFHPADYEMNEQREYTVHCRALEHGMDILNVSFSVPSEDAAQTVCRGWEKNASRVYEYLIQTLLFEKDS